MAKIAPPEVWDKHILATLKHMTNNARRAKAALRAQNDLEANVPYDDVQAACTIQGQMSAAIRDLAATYPWTQQAYIQKMSSQTYPEDEPRCNQTMPKAPYRQVHRRKLTLK